MMALRCAQMECLYRGGAKSGFVGLHARKFNMTGSTLLAKLLLRIFNYKLGFV